MKYLTFVFGLLFLTLLVAAQNNRISYNGQEIFLNGTNLAWINFANDIGQDNVDFEQFGEVFKEIHDYGANSVRLWLHTTGTTTPAFENDTVVGPGIGAIDDLKQILDSAYKYDVGLILCLWSFDMMRSNLGEPYLTRNRKLLEEEAALNSYIEYALKPMVDSTKNHPGIIAWEVFNEPEGMIDGAPNGGWSHVEHVQRSDVQRVVNHVAGAIHRIDTNLLVTNGTHTLNSLTNKGSGNFYADSALIEVGGDTMGTLDFYQAHYYDFDLNPFVHDASNWGLDKPLLLGEFYPNCETCGDFSNYETLIDSGYAGAMGWMWLSSHKDDIKEETQNMLVNHSDDIAILNNQGLTPYLLLNTPENGAEFESGSDVELLATAADVDGNVVKVEFFMEFEGQVDSLLATVTESADSTYSYTLSGVEDGFYKVFAFVIDNDGYTKRTSSANIIIGDPPVYRYEAEDAYLEGEANIREDATASGSAFVDLNTSFNLKWGVYNCPVAGTYNMIVGYSMTYGIPKANIFVINENEASSIEHTFDKSDDGWLRDTISIELVEGTNMVELKPSWGWMAIDFIEFPFVRPPLAESLVVSTESGENEITTEGGTIQMIATVEPEESADVLVNWKVNSSAIATIDSKGLLTAISNGAVKVTATAVDGSKVEDSMNITVSFTSGIQEVRSDVIIYPNPACNTLNIEHVTTIDKVNIYNAQGMLVYSQSNVGISGQLDIANLPTGYYCLELITINGKQNVEFFMKQ